MPDGADAVVMVEETDIDERGAVSIFARGGSRDRTSAGRARTSRKVSTSCSRARCSTPAASGSIAALGLTEVEVYEKPRVAILSTGNEIVDPGQPLAPGQIYDINRVTVSAVVSDNGGIPIPYRTAADTIEDLSRAVEECLEQDVMVFSGGSSVGERDLILDVVASKGEMLFHGIAVKPGKPTAFGRIKGRLFFGMPGYPTSCLSNSYILLAPALRRLARLPQQIVRSLTLPLECARRVGAGPAPVLLGARRERRGRARLQGLGRHHEHVAGRRIHRDSR